MIALLNCENEHGNRPWFLFTPSFGEIIMNYEYDLASFENDRFHFGFISVPENENRNIDKRSVNKFNRKSSSIDYVPMIISVRSCNEFTFMITLIILRIDVFACFT